MNQLPWDLLISVRVMSSIQWSNNCGQLLILVGYYPPGKKDPGGFLEEPLHPSCKMVVVCQGDMHDITLSRRDSVYKGQRHETSQFQKSTNYFIRWDMVHSPRLHKVYAPFPGLSYLGSMITVPSAYFPLHIQTEGS